MKVDYDERFKDIVNNLPELKDHSKQEQSLLKEDYDKNKDEDRYSLFCSHCGKVGHFKNVLKIRTSGESYSDQVECPMCGHTTEYTNYSRWNYYYNHEDDPCASKNYSYEIIGRQLFIVLRLYDLWTDSINLGYYIYDLDTFNYNVMREELLIVTYYDKSAFNYCSSIKKGLIKKLKNLFPYSGIEIKFSSEDDSIYGMSTIMAFVHAYVKNNGIEQLIKAGFGLQVDMYLSCIRDNVVTGVKQFESCFKPGKNIKEIIQVPKYIYKDLMGERDLSVWNEWRISYNKYNLTVDSYNGMKDLLRNKNSITLFKRILNRNKKDKAYYTVDSLINYLRRVDMFQAIPVEDALILINDYVRMSIDMEIEPSINSNSLKREHDVTARNYKVKLDKQTEEAFNGRVEHYKTFEYENSKYCIIAPTCAGDVIQEGRNNNNCVGSYVKSMIDRNVLIFFLRKKNELQNSYVTIQISPDSFDILQAYERSNTAMRDSDAKTFIEEWKDWVISTHDAAEEDIAI